MTTTLTRPPTPPPVRSPRLLLIGSLALLVLAAAVAAWTLLRSDGPSQIEIVKQINADYDFNDADEVPFSYADVDRWLGNFADDASILGGSVNDPAVRDVLAAFDIWDEEVVFLAEPERLDSDQIRVQARHTDAFHGAGGLVMNATHTYRFNGDNEVVHSYLQTQEYDDYKAFEAAFIEWYESVAFPGETLERGDGGLRWNAENAAISVATVHDFLVFSDEYPIQR
jgi:hypothetical protein